MKRTFDTMASGLHAPTTKAPRQSAKSHDDLLHARQEREMFRIPRSEFAEHRHAPPPGDVGARGILSGADPYQTLSKREARRAEFRLPTREFTQRQRYRDADGNAFAPALADDPLYRALQSHGIVDELDPRDAQRASERKGNARGLPRRKPVVVTDERGTSGKLYGNVLFYVSMKPDGLLHKWPTGDIEFVDPNTEQLFTGTVKRAIFRGRSKGGYVVLENVVEWGRMSNPSDFARAK